MRNQIGLLAGKAWSAIGAQPGILMSSLSKTLGVDPSLAVFACGWLAREDKITIVPQGRDFKLSLLEKEQEGYTGTPAKK